MLVCFVLRARDKTQTQPTVCISRLVTMRLSQLASSTALLLLLFASTVHNLSEEQLHPDHRYWQYIVLGAGPSGLQMGHFLQKADRDYVILERANGSGSFYETYPRHDRLISINKRHTGKTNAEFNLRHDWNSLLSDDPSLLFKEYSQEFFPWRKDAVRYFNDYERKQGLRVLHNVEVGNVRRLYHSDQGQYVYAMEDQWGHQYVCTTLLLGTGLWKPNIPDIAGLHMADGYESVDTDPTKFEGKTVLVLGHGNAAFETADAIYGHANLVHVVGRSRVRLSWETHYVGDVRAVNNAILDTYQLKSMDGVVEGALNDIHFHRDAAEPDRISLSLNYTQKDNFALRHSYDHIIRCLGFTFDDTIFNQSKKPHRGSGKLSKYPMLNHDHQAVGFPDMYVIGTASHSLDFRKSSGGFIHGYRYTVRMVHRLLEWQKHRVRWPSVRLPLTQLLAHVLKRVNEASGMYQMFGVLADVISISEDGTYFEYIEEFPINMLPQFTNCTGHRLQRHFVLVLQYGPHYSGPGKDVFHESRATGHADQAHRSNFLHPVFYYYSRQITAAEFASRPEHWLLPRPLRIHHTVEDFLTTWKSLHSHILPLRRFFEQCTNSDLRNFALEDCYYFALTKRNLPLSCKQMDLNGLGLTVPGDIRVVNPNIHMEHLQI